jgi:hypothetical protein
MTGRDAQEDVARYAARVRAALDGAPAGERAEMLEGLEAHLAEVAAEPGPPLAARLGPPARYAAELRAAFGGGGPTASAPGRPRVPLPRVIRLGLLGTVLLMGAAAGLLAWQAATAGVPSDRWSYQELLDRARAGQVSQVEITGRTAVATARDGRHHSVSLPATTASMAASLTAADVNVTYREPPGAGFWLAVLLPNLVLWWAAAALLPLMAWGAGYLVWRPRPRAL